MSLQWQLLSGLGYSPEKESRCASLPSQAILNSSPMERTAIRMRLQPESKVIINTATVIQIISSVIILTWMFYHRGASSTTNANRYSLYLSDNSMIWNLGLQMMFSGLMHTSWNCPFSTRATASSSVWNFPTNSVLVYVSRLVHTTNAACSVQ